MLTSSMLLEPLRAASSRSPFMAIFAASMLLMLGMVVYGAKLSGYQMTLTAAIVLIGLLPMLSYLRHPSGRYPLGQAALLYHGVSYGLVCFSSSIYWLGVPVEYIDKALELTLEGVVGLWLGFRLSSLVRFTGKDAFADVSLEKTLNWAALLIVLNLLRYPLPSLNDIPTLAHITQAGSWIGIALLLTAYLRGRLSLVHQFGLAAALLFEGAYRLASGLLGNLALLFLVVGFVFWRERGRIPILPLVLGFATLGVFGPVKSEWRDRIWFTSEKVSTVEKLSVLMDLTEDYYLNGVHPKNDAAERNVNRLATTPTLAWVSFLCPRQVGYWNGYSYNALLYSLLPRFLFPEKPVSAIGNEFGRRYLLLDTFDYVTSYNLPWLIEFYVNFGEFAVLPGMLLSGLLLGWVTAGFGGACSDLRFAIGMAATHQLFFAESNFALMWGNVILSVVFFTVAARFWFRR